MADLISTVIDLASSWRFFLCAALTGLAWYAILHLVPDGTAQWVLCAITGAGGLGGGFYWQIRADDRP
ncbi:hypothetical protein [Luteimonas aquatica]|uniref:hypothetical protein n=1 Tax=Luteimonas aquatica TaxID=450364 RepID=UPI001F5A5AE7|nr:hypothetical protein [Luteimonas aquatica]